MRSRVRPPAPEFAFEIAQLRRVVVSASVLGALAACGGRVTDDGTRREPSTDDTTTPADAGTTTSYPPPPPSCQDLPWTFQCATDGDAGAQDPDAGPGDPDRPAPPPCASLASDQKLCSKNCFGPDAKNVCSRSESSYDSQHYLYCSVGLASDGPAPALRTVTCQISLPGGRRPAAYEPPACDPSEAGGWLAGLAHLEAASIDAFCILAQELAEHDAPAPLIAAAARSAQDEVRHAKIIRRLAEEQGARVEEVPHAPRTKRTLFELARENAVEGCVRETFGALVAMWQAQAASAPRIRKHMARIAEDEARHAALAWHVAAWAESRLSEEENLRVAEEKRRAEAELDREIAITSDSAALRWLGVPTRAESMRLRQAYAATVS